MAYYRNVTTGTVYNLTHSDPRENRSDGHEWQLLSDRMGKEAYRDSMRADLRDRLKPGDTVYTILRHVSSSGMSRRISLAYVADGRICDITYSAAIALGSRVSDKGGILVGGCGMDMGFHLVYSLGAALWPDGTPEPHGNRNGEPDSTGGYALKHCWA
jgi:hypothetical protein